MVFAESPCKPFSFLWRRVPQSGGVGFSIGWFWLISDLEIGPISRYLLQETSHKILNKMSRTYLLQEQTSWLWRRVPQSGGLGSSSS